jgi:hypothetical protein
MTASKGRVPVAIRTHHVDRRLWFASLAIIVAMVAVARMVSGPQPHVGSAVVVRLAAAAIVTACAAVANFAAGPRAAAVTSVVGVLIAIVVLTRPA